jgi:hypothetical protein
MALMTETHHTEPAAVAANERPLAARIAIAFLWFFPVYIASRIGIAAMVGVLASIGTSATTYQQGHDLGRAAALAFFSSYAWAVLVFQIALTVLLAVYGILPGTGRYRKKLRT